MLRLPKQPELAVNVGSKRFKLSMVIYGYLLSPYSESDWADRDGTVNTQDQTTTSSLVPYPSPPYSLLAPPISSLLPFSGSLLPRPWSLNPSSLLFPRFFPLLPPFCSLLPSSSSLLPSLCHVISQCTQLPLGAIKIMNHATKLVRRERLSSRIIDRLTTLDFS
jgi:hypothetical protein